MTTLRFTKDHEWIVVEGDVGTIGITAYAQEQLGDVVYVELPEVGTVLEAGQQAAVVESVKAASEVYAPVAGSVTEVNGRLADEPALVNSNPTGEGWFLRMRLADPAAAEALMDQAAYDAYVASL